MWFSRAENFVQIMPALNWQGERNDSALEKLQAETQAQIPNQMPDSMTAFGISRGLEER